MAACQRRPCLISAVADRDVGLGFPLRRMDVRFRSCHRRLCLAAGGSMVVASMGSSRCLDSPSTAVESFSCHVMLRRKEGCCRCPNWHWTRMRSGGKGLGCLAIGEMGSDHLSEGQALDGSGKVGVADRRRMYELAMAAGTTVVLGVGNRVLHKLALIPLKQYPFFLAQLATFGYVIVYFTILHVRYHAGIVTHEMLSMPKFPYICVGLLEAVASAAGMASAAMLSGASIPILSQTFLVWQLILSAIFLGRRYKVNQLFGCFLVIVGVVITVASGSTPVRASKDSGLLWIFLMIFSFFLQAADTVLKEIIFFDSSKHLKGGPVDLFVVNSYGSAFQALFVFLSLPLMSKLWGVPFSELSKYLQDGAACFLNVGGSTNGCAGAPVLPLLFVIVNMGFNISLLHLLMISSAVVSSLASTFSVPIAVYMFTLPLPYLGVGSALPAGFVAGAVILVIGMIIYAWNPSSRHKPKPRRKDFSSAK